MARPKDKPVFTPPGWRQALKSWFLHYAFHHHPEALIQLAAEVRSSVITARQWAKRYDVAETWVEEWAGDALETWWIHPNLLSPSILYPPPQDDSTTDDVFSFKVALLPPSKLSLGITMGGIIQDVEDDDWKRFKKQLHQSLEDALNSYRAKASETLIPRDLLRKTEAAAVYFFCGMIPEAILPKLDEKVEEASTVYRWIKEIANLLELPMRTKGHRRRV